MHIPMLPREVYQLHLWARWHEEILIGALAIERCDLSEPSRFIQKLNEPYWTSISSPAWQYAHHTRRMESEADEIDIYAIDGVPWAIHEMPDQSAYEIALAEYRREQARLKGQNA